MVDAKEQEEYQKFLEYLQRGPFLLDLKEFDGFHFILNFEDKEISELGSMLAKEGVNDSNYASTIGPKAIEILKKVFTKDKEKELCGILDKVENGYASDAEVTKTVLASKLFLENEQAKHYYMPLAITRLLEDIFAASSSTAQWDLFLKPIDKV